VRERKVYDPLGLADGGDDRVSSGSGQGVIAGSQERMDRSLLERGSAETALQLERIGSSIAAIAWVLFFSLMLSLGLTLWSLTHDSTLSALALVSSGIILGAIVYTLTTRSH